MNFSQQNQNYRQFNAAPVSLFLHLQLLISSYIWTHCRLESILMLDFRSNLMIWNPSLPPRFTRGNTALFLSLFFPYFHPKKSRKKSLAEILIRSSFSFSCTCSKGRKLFRAYLFSDLSPDRTYLFSPRVP